MVGPKVPNRDKRKKEKKVNIGSAAFLLFVRTIYLPFFPGFVRTNKSFFCFRLLGNGWGGGGGGSLSEAGKSDQTKFDRTNRPSVISCSNGKTPLLNYLFLLDIIPQR